MAKEIVVAAGGELLCRLFAASAGGQAIASGVTWIDQHPGIRLQPCPGAKQADGVDAFDPQPRTAQPAAVRGWHGDGDGPGIAGFDIDPGARLGVVGADPQRPARSSGVVIEADLESRRIAREYRCGAHGDDLHAEQIAVGVVHGDERNRAEPEREREGQAVLVIGRTQQHDREQHGEQRAAACGQDIKPAPRHGERQRANRRASIDEARTGIAGAPAQAHERHGAARGVCFSRMWCCELRKTFPRSRIRAVIAAESPMPERYRVPASV